MTLCRTAGMEEHRLPPEPEPKRAGWLIPPLMMKAFHKQADELVNGKQYSEVACALILLLHDTPPDLMREYIAAVREAKTFGAWAEQVHLARLGKIRERAEKKRLPVATTPLHTGEVEKTEETTPAGDRMVTTRKRGQPSPNKSPRR